MSIFGLFDAHPTITNNTRSDSLELKAFLETVLPAVENNLTLTNPELSKKDHDFLINKARMYRNDLNRIIEIVKLFRILF